MEFASRRFADVVVAEPAGRVDYAAAQALEQALTPLISAEARSAGLVLDFARVDYISSVGLRVLMIAAKETRARGARIAIAALQPVVTEIFAISRFDAVLDAYPSVRAALASLSPAALAAYDGSPGTAPT